MSLGNLATAKEFNAVARARESGRACHNWYRAASFLEQTAKVHGLKSTMPVEKLLTVIYLIEGPEVLELPMDFVMVLYGDEIDRLVSEMGALSLLEAEMTADQMMFFYADASPDAQTIMYAKVASTCHTIISLNTAEAALKYAHYGMKIMREAEDGDPMLSLTATAHLMQVEAACQQLLDIPRG